MYSKKELEARRGRDLSSGNATDEDIGCAADDIGNEVVSSPESVVRRQKLIKYRSFTSISTRWIDKRYWM